LHHFQNAYHSESTIDGDQEVKRAVSGQLIITDCRAIRLEVKLHVKDTCRPTCTVIEV